MTTSMNSLHKRLDKLEGPYHDRDFEQEALDALSDEDLDVLQEANALYHSGYSKSEIANMMGEMWPQVEIAIEHYQAEMARLMESEHERPKRLMDHETASALAPVNYRAGKRVR